MRGRFRDGEITFPHPGDGVADGRLQAAEAEIEPAGILQKRAWERHRLRDLPVCGDTRDRRAARIGQSQHGGDFVKRLTSRIVDRAAQHLEVGWRAAVVQAGVTAADNHPDAGKHILVRWRSGRRRRARAGD